MDRLLEFSRRTSELSQDFYPSIILKPDCNYVVGLYSLSTYNSLTNIKEGVNDVIGFKIQKTDPKTKEQSSSEFEVSLPAGSYEIAQIEENIKQAIHDYFKFSLSVEPKTMRVQMECDQTVVFSGNNSIRDILGFENNVYLPGYHISERVPQITALNTINVECNIVAGDGSFRNGKKSHTLYSFYPDVPTGYKLLERPTNILFLPVSTKEISNVTLRLTDQYGHLVNFNNEEITIHLILRQL
jgi:hypothetical protein